MTILERIDAFAGSFYAALGGAVVAGVVWLIRTIFTNQKALSKLQTEVEAREAARAVERAALIDIASELRIFKDETRSDLGEIKKDVKELYRRRRRLESDERGDG